MVPKDFKERPEALDLREVSEAKGKKEKQERQVQSHISHQSHRINLSTFSQRFQVHQVSKLDSEFSFEISSFHVELHRPTRSDGGSSTSPTRAAFPQ